MTIKEIYENLSSVLCDCTDTCVIQGSDTDRHIIEECLSALRDLEVTELSLCEQDRLVLKPDQLYRFVVMPNCKRCIDLVNQGD